MLGAVAFGVGGLSTAEVARGLLVPEATMAKRLTRAKQKIARARIPYRVPAAEELPARLAGVAATIRGLSPNTLLLLELATSDDDATVIPLTLRQAHQLHEALGKLLTTAGT